MLDTPTEVSICCPYTGEAIGLNHLAANLRSLAIAAPAISNILNVDDLVAFHRDVEALAVALHQEIKVIRYTDGTHD